MSRLAGVFKHGVVPLQYQALLSTLGVGMFREQCEINLKTTHCDREAARDNNTTVRLQLSTARPLTCISFSFPGGTDRRTRIMSGTSSGEKVKENSDQSTSSVKGLT